MVHSSLHEDEQDGKVGDSGWLEKGELGVVPEVTREKDIKDLVSVRRKTKLTEKARKNRESLSSSLGGHLQLHSYYHMSHTLTATYILGTFYLSCQYPAHCFSFLMRLQDNFMEG